MSSTAGAIERRLDADREVAIQRQVVVVLAHATLVILVALSAILLLRWLSGAFQQPLAGGAIVLAAVGLELVALGVRRLFGSAALQKSVLGTEYFVLSAKRFHVQLSSVDLISVLAVFAVAISLSIAGTSVWGLIAAWFIVLGGETVQRLPRFQLPLFRSPSKPASPSPSPVLIAADEEVAEPEIPVGLIQQVTRVVEDGRESVHALVKADVAANDRLAVVHLAFCPPLNERPELTAHALDSDEAEIRVTQAESFGARIEARLTAVSKQPRCLVIEVLGSATANPDS